MPDWTGTNSEDPVIVLPGEEGRGCFFVVTGAGTAELVKPMATRLNNEGASVIVFPLRGFGYEQEALSNVSRAEWTFNLNQAVEQVQHLGPIHMVGHSLGCLVILRSLALGLQSVKRVTLFNPLLKIKHRIETLGRSSKIQLRVAKLLYSTGVSADTVESVNAHELKTLGTKHWTSHIVMEVLQLRREVLNQPKCKGVKIEIIDGRDDPFCSSKKSDGPRFGAVRMDIKGGHFLPQDRPKRTSKILLAGRS